MKAIIRLVVLGVALTGIVVAASGKKTRQDQTENKAITEDIGGVLKAAETGVEAAEAMTLLEQPPTAKSATSGTALVDVPEKYWSDYFAARPKTFLVDPQNLLSAADKRERLEFLNYHASDSSIDLFIYVFGGDQEIPGEVREEEMAERLFSEGRPAAMIFYFMGDPERSLMHFSPSLVSKVPVAEQRRAMESSVMQALAKADASGQFEAFLVQMSVRIYWIERLLGVGDEHAEKIAVHAKAPVVARKNSKLAELVAPHMEKFREFAIPVAAAGGALLLLLVLRFWLKRRRLYRFPDLEVEPRLGGAHAASVGGVISFASATVPPASQRHQMPEYLRRM